MGYFTLSKNKLHYRLRVVERYRSQGEWCYTFYDPNDDLVTEEYSYRGNALNLREGKQSIEVGDLVEFDARHLYERGGGFLTNRDGSKRYVKTRILSNISGKRLIKEAEDTAQYESKERK